LQSFSWSQYRAFVGAVRKSRLRAAPNAAKAACLLSSSQVEFSPTWQRSHFTSPDPHPEPCEGNVASEIVVTAANGAGHRAVVIKQVDEVDEVDAGHVSHVLAYWFVPSSWV